MLVMRSHGPAIGRYDCSYYAWCVRLRSVVTPTHSLIVKDKYV